MEQYTEEDKFYELQISAPLILEIMKLHGYFKSSFLLNRDIMQLQQGAIMLNFKIFIKYSFSTVDIFKKK